jgi:hypothetical protein
MPCIAQEAALAQENGVSAAERGAASQAADRPTLLVFVADGPWCPGRDELVRAFGRGPERRGERGAVGADEPSARGEAADAVGRLLVDSLVEHFDVEWIELPLRAPRRTADGQVDAETDAQRLARLHEVATLPHFVFVDGAGRPVLRVTRFDPADQGAFAAAAGAALESLEQRRRVLAEAEALTGPARVRRLDSFLRDLDEDTVHRFFAAEVDVLLAADTYLPDLRERQRAWRLSRDRFLLAEAWRALERSLDRAVAAGASPDELRVRIRQFLATYRPSGAARRAVLLRRAQVAMIAGDPAAASADLAEVLASGAKDDAVARTALALQRQIDGR